MTSELASIAVLLGQQRGFENISFVGKGAFKETYCVMKNNQAYALKIFHPTKCDIKRTTREISILLKCESSSLARLFEYGSISEGGHEFHFVLEEYLGGGTLSDKLKNGVIAVPLTKQYGYVLARCLQLLKSINLVHRDIKPENIMFRMDQVDPVLLDFGIARDLSEVSLTATWLPQGPGTPFFSSPEQLNNDKGLIDWRTDQFCLGLVLAVCLTGRHPFESNSSSISDIIASVANRAPLPDTNRQLFSQIGMPELSRMLKPWPVQRYQTPEELLKDFKK